MSDRHRSRSIVAAGLVALATLGVSASVKPPAEPAVLRLEVSPDTTSAGESIEVTLNLQPKSGIKINKYPRITMKVDAIEGLVGAGEASVGNDQAPPPDQLETNYYKAVDPVVLRLTLDPGAKAGEHLIPAHVKYFYCVTDSGFCAPKKVTLQIPVNVN